MSGNVEDGAEATLFIEVHGLAAQAMTITRRIDGHREVGPPMASVQLRGRVLDENGIMYQDAAIVIPVLPQNAQPAALALLAAADAAEVAREEDRVESLPTIETMIRHAD